MTVATVKPVVKKFVETNIFENYTILEDKAAPGIVKVRGIFQKADTKNGNGRIYPKSLWSKVLTNESLRERLTSKMILGEVEHPADGMTDLKRVSHIITDLEYDEATGDVVGTAEILDTPNGAVIKELFKRGVKVGISSRGKGTSSMKGDTEVVNDDYVLETFDFVYNPSTPGAFPEVVNESKSEEPTGGDPMQNVLQLKRIESRARDIRKLFESANPSDLGRFEDELLEAYVSASKLGNEDPTSLDYAKEVVGAVTEVRKAVKAKLEAPVAPAVTESVATPKKAERRDEEEGGEDEEEKKAMHRARHDDEETYESDFSCVKCGYTEQFSVKGASAVAKMFTMPFECCKCGSGVRVEMITRKSPNESAGECPKCPGQELQTEAKSGKNVCQKCGHSESMLSSMTKGEAVRRLMAASKLAEGLMEKCRMFWSSNRVLRRRNEAAVKLVQDIVQDSAKAAVAQHVEGLIVKTPGLGKARGILSSCKSIAEVDSKVTELMAFIETKVEAPAKAPVKPAAKVEAVKPADKVITQAPKPVVTPRAAALRESHVRQDRSTLPVTADDKANIGAGPTPVLPSDKREKLQLEESGSWEHSLIAKVLNRNPNLV